MGLEKILAMDALAESTTPEQYWAAMVKAVPAELIRTLEFALTTGMAPEAIVADGKNGMSQAMEKAYLNALRWRRSQLQESLSSKGK